MERPVFIVGCGHSGTSLLLRILGHHSSFHAIPKETSVFRKWDPRFLYWHPRGWLETLTTQRRILTSFKSACEEVGKSRWIEKTPRHVHSIRSILSLYPEARIIFLVRDGRNVCCSIRERNGSMRKAVARWVRDCKAGLRHLSDERLMLVKHEMVIDDQDAEISKILEFLGEPIEPLIDRFNRSCSPKENLSAAVRGEDLQSSYDRLRLLRANQLTRSVYRAGTRWQNELSDTEKRYFKAKAGKLLIELGYVKDSAW